MFVAWNEQTLAPLDLETGVRAAAAAGFSAVELLDRRLEGYLQQHTLADLQALLSGLGLRVLTINTLGAVTFLGEKWPQVEARAHRLCELAAAIGRADLCLEPGDRPQGATWRDVRRDCVAALARVAGIAASYGVRLAFEFLGPAHYAVPTLDQAWEVVQEVGRADVGLALDSFHYYVGRSSWEALAAVDPRSIFVFHINDVEDLPREQLTDAHRLLPGEGVLPLPAMIAELHAKGYRGPCSVEVMRPAYWQRDPVEYCRAARQATEAVLASVLTSGHR